MNTTQIQSQLEGIFSEVNNRLETLISQYRSLCINADDDPLHERVFAFCDELEGLKKKISNKNETLSTRIDSVGNISEYLQDFISDVKDRKQSRNAKTLKNEIDSVLSTIELIKPDSTGLEDKILGTSQTVNESYFIDKKTQLEKLVADHPEWLRN